MSKYSHLTSEERDRTAGLKANGLSLGAIARALGRAASTISREIGRNALECQSQSKMGQCPGEIFPSLGV